MLVFLIEKKRLKDILTECMVIEKSQIKVSDDLTIVLNLNITMPTPCIQFPKSFKHNRVGVYLVLTDRCLKEMTTTGSLRYSIQCMSDNST